MLWTALKRRTVRKQMSGDIHVLLKLIIIFGICELEHNILKCDYIRNYWHKEHKLRVSLWLIAK